MTWHPEAQLLRAYLENAMDDASRWSVESHLTDCPACRAEYLTDGNTHDQLERRLDRVWVLITDEIEPIPQNLPRRFLRAFGVPDHLATLVSATPALRASWLLGVALTLVALVSVARAAYSWPSGGASLIFLVGAPLIPLLTVSVSFGPHVDPLHDIAIAAPFPAVRLLLARTIAVLGATFPLTALAALALPGADWAATAWVIPALMLTAVALAGSSWVHPGAACAGTATAWLVAVLALRGHSDLVAVAFGTAGQLAMLAAAACAVTLLAARVDRLETRVAR